MEATNIASPTTQNSTAVVHKQGSEGVIQIDNFTGAITTPKDERPDWAEDLQIAGVAERHRYYSTALGPLYTAELQFPEAMAYEDLSWLCIRPLGLDDNGEPLTITDETGQPSPLEHYEQEADLEFRSEFVATVTGNVQDIDRDAGTIKHGLTVDIPLSQERSAEEMASFEDSQKESFGKVAEG